MPLGWIRGYQRPWIRWDLLAGLTAAAVVIPQAMAYASIATVPLQTGIACALLPALVYATLGTARALSVSTTSSIAILTAAVIADQAGDDPTQTATGIALLAGGIVANEFWWWLRPVRKHERVGPQSAVVCHCE